MYLIHAFNDMMQWKVFGRWVLSFAYIRPMKLAAFTGWRDENFIRFLQDNKQTFSQRKSCKIKMSRVILCKFGRFGELVKVMDKTTTNPITLPTPTNNSNSDFKNSISVSVEENCFWCLRMHKYYVFTYIHIIVRILYFKKNFNSN